MYVGVNSVCGFRHPLGVLDHTPTDKGGTMYHLSSEKLPNNPIIVSETKLSNSD